MTDETLPIALERVAAWLHPRWPSVLVFGGLLLFWTACLASDALPIEAFFLGPGLMLAGAILRARQRR
ncbi:MAG: hypothetical protein ABSH49_01680 [Bryobacteraceae bacterium]|jgi:hypothetical protein